eukprot:Opistho-2@43810
MAVHVTLLRPLLALLLITCLCAHVSNGAVTPSDSDPACTSECPDAAVPSGCGTLAPTNANEALVVSSCMAVASGTYVFQYVNVIAGGTLFFVDDGGEIDFAANSILVENGGSLIAGAYCKPFWMQRREA